ncbi:MAG: methyl-accepting chemotaxis protein [Lachnospiraceae bacterium]|nr:methyl-accepting chemotaxis protein [Lachnospiraceae bacterium]
MKDNKVVSIRWTLLGIAILPALIIGVVLAILSVNKMDKGMEEEVLSGLKQTCVAARAGFDCMAEGDFSINENNELMKGDFNISQHMEEVDDFVKGVEADVTVFYGNVRYATSLRDATTGERIIGTTAGDAVSKAVLGGSEYESSDVVINNKDYYAYYIPLTNPDGSVVGMVFAGSPKAGVDAKISSASRIIIVIAVVFVLAACLIAIFISNGIISAIRSTQEVVGKLSAGDLTTKVDRKILSRKDELGAVGRDIQNFIKRMREIISNIQNSANGVNTSGEELESMAGQTSASADEIASAVDDISRGSVSQAEDVETAAERVSEMGSLIEEIVGNIKTLNETSLEMQKAGEDSERIIKELSESNDMTVEAIVEVQKNVQATDESVKKISEALNLIVNIASQTNLLSLNASIEAARAGEAGRGFAVVATEIQNLSEESNKSANTIGEIINVLAQDSENSIKVMENVMVRLKETQEKLNETKDRFSDVSQGIVTSRGGTDTINGQALDCDSARSQVVDVVSNLSAISEENAASTQQTTASMQELNATINLLAQSAASLKEMANELNSETQFFKIEEA